MHYCEHFAVLTQPKLPPSNKYACNVCKAQPPLVWQCITVTHLSFLERVWSDVL